MLTSRQYNKTNSIKLKIRVDFQPHWVSWAVGLLIIDIYVYVKITYTQRQQLLVIVSFSLMQSLDQPVDSEFSSMIS